MISLDGDHSSKNGSCVYSCELIQILHTRYLGLISSYSLPILGVKTTVYLDNTLLPGDFSNVHRTINKANQAPYPCLFAALLTQVVIIVYRISFQNSIVKINHILRLTIRFLTFFFLLVAVIVSEFRQISDLLDQPSFHLLLVLMLIKIFDLVLRMKLDDFRFIRLLQALVFSLLLVLWKVFRTQIQPYNPEVQ
jgi:hypothetical protein